MLNGTLGVTKKLTTTGRISIRLKLLTLVSFIFLITLTFNGNLTLSQGVREKLEKVKKIQEKHEKNLFGKVGVTAVGIGLMEGGTDEDFAIHVFLNSILPGAAAANIPLDLDGVPIRIVETDEVRPRDMGPAHRKQYNLPVPMGVSTGNANGCFAGTLGVRVYRTDATSRVGYITNAHVAAAGGDSLCPGLGDFSEDQFQRGRLDNGCKLGGLRKIGDLVQHVPIVMGGLFENTVDCAFVASNRMLVNKSILDVGIPSPFFVAPALNMPVQKSGRTTGLTVGTITSINVTVNVSYSCGTAKFVGQIGITPSTFSDAGDSGSLILHGTMKDSSNRFAPVGLLFAGSATTTFANRISDVLGALGSTIDTF